LKRQQLVTVCYGIDFTEVKDGFEDGIKPSAVIKVNNFVEPPVKPVATNYGFGPVMIALPMVKESRDNKVAGCCRRVLRAVPKADKSLYLELQAFVGEFVQEFFEPILPDEDVSFETWIQTTKYPEGRRQELRVIHGKLLENCWEDTKILVCKCFQKWEHYIDWKHSRGIMSRTDEAKVLLAPIFKIIEMQVFKLPYFIKKIPVAERPDYIMKMISGLCRVGTNDFTAFESLFTKELMLTIEMQLYRHMGQHFPKWLDLVDRCLLGHNVMQFKQFTAYVESCRMSGEMCTSLGNGFSNLMILLFICHKSGIDWRNVKCVIEGDDSLFEIHEGFDEELYVKLGLRAKLETFDEVSEASFCGIVFDVEDRINLTDPRKVLASVGWGPMKYHKARKNLKLGLLRAKALSFAHQYPGCPIVDVLSHRLLYLTRSKQARVDSKDWYKNSNVPTDQELIRDIVRRGATPTPLRSRLLVEKLYGIAVEEQVRLENMINEWEIDGNCDSLLLTSIVPQSWCQYADKYVWQVDDDGSIPCLHDPGDVFGHAVFLKAMYAKMAVAKPPN